MALRNEAAEIRAGDTEPLEIEVGALGLSNLDGFVSGAFYAKKVGASENHVDGAPVVVGVSANLTVRFDPVGNGPDGADAFGVGDQGIYDCYVKIVWSDGDETRHPGGQALSLVVHENWE